MEPVLRALFIYLFLLVVFRLSGKRTLSETTTFDLVLLLIISETTQQAMVGDDHSLTNAVVLILTLSGVDIVLSYAKHLFPALDTVLDGVPVIVLRDGRIIDQPAGRERIDADDILEAARLHHGLERLSQIKLAVLERDGQISIIPRA